MGDATPKRQVGASCGERCEWEIQPLTRNEMTQEILEEVKPAINQRAFASCGHAPPPHSHTRESFSSPAMNFHPEIPEG